jgi:phage terminase large subunit
VIVIEVNKEVNPRFEDFIFDWDYKTQLLVGGYGSSKSYHIALKIVLKCFEEKRKVLVVREVYDTHRESTYSLFCEILEEIDLLADSPRQKNRKVLAKESPFTLTFPNGSKIIFRGMDKPAKLKSINGISIVWLEECSEIKYAGYKELLGRLRHPTLSLHFILSTNPVGTENWVYTHFFKRVDENGDEVVILDDERLYKKRTIVKNGVYYHHSLPDVNLFLPKDYIKQLDEMKEYDPDLYRVARLGRFGMNGIKVLPQFEIANSHFDVMSKVMDVPKNLRRIGFDFGFETSYNAVVKIAIDDKNKYLYIYQEYYRNKMTDDKTSKALVKWDKNIQEQQIIADCEDPKAIQFYRQEGFKIRGCKKYAGSRLANTKKVKRFKKIICSPDCTNVIRELKSLTYAKDNKDQLIYDEFNIDPHTFSAIWYALDGYTVANIKEIKRNSRKGA